MHEDTCHDVNSRMQLNTRESCSQNPDFGRICQASHIVWFRFFYVFVWLLPPRYFQMRDILYPHPHHDLSRLTIPTCSGGVSVSDADESVPSYEVLVGVLSARHHYDLRRAIRKTWLGYLRDHPHFKHRSVSSQLQLLLLFLSPSLQGRILRD